MGNSKPNVREITFYTDSSYRQVRVEMPTDDEVVFSECLGIGESFREVSRGKFRIHGNALRYYQAKREQLLTEGWIILSVTMRVYNGTDDAMRCGMFVKLKVNHTEENEIEVVTQGTDEVLGVLKDDIAAASYGVCQTYGIASVSSGDMKAVIKAKIDEWAKRGVVNLSKMESLDVKEVGKSITISANDLEGPFDDEVQP